MALLNQYNTPTEGLSVNPRSPRNARGMRVWQAPRKETIKAERNTKLRLSESVDFSTLDVVCLFSNSRYS